jgi:long-chain acyl-CoA synthetase
MAEPQTPQPQSPSQQSAFRSLPDLFLDRVARTPDRDAFWSPNGTDWRHWTWKQGYEQVRAIACGLRVLGLPREQRCAILSSTRVEWLFADLAILCAGGTTTTVYPSSTADECAFILQDSETVLAFAEDARQVDKLRRRRAQLPGLRRVIVFDGPGDGDWVLGLDELVAMGRVADAADRAQFERLARAVGPQDLATIIYTSGTTGRPKGVELVHDAWLYAAEGIDALQILSLNDLQYLWLPLSHAFGKVIEAVQLRIGFCSAVDGRVDRIVDNLRRVRPTFVAGVPRIFEKVHNKIVTDAEARGGLALRVFRWAFDVGQRYLATVRAGQRPPALLALERRLADRLVFSRLRAALCGRLRFFVSGAAPLSREVAAFFQTAGILVLEGYGLTESTAASFINLPDRFVPGSVGPPLPGTEVRIAPDGEVLLRGRGIMRSYHHQPEATAEVLDAHGWLHTGDIGTLDEHGALQITDRKKDLIKTSGGKYVAPQKLEGRLKAACPYVSQVLVYGNNRNYCTALVTLDEPSVRRWARDRGLGELPWPDLARRDELRALVQAAVDEANRELSSFETIKRFAVVPEDFSQERGELTPSLKIKRKVVEEHFAPILRDLYGAPRTA